MRVREPIPPCSPGSYGPAIKTASYYKSPTHASKIKLPRRLKPRHENYFNVPSLFIFSGDSAMPEASAEKKRPASAASNKEDSSDEKSEKSSRRSVTPEPAKKKKKIDPVRLFFLTFPACF